MFYYLSGKPKSQIRRIWDHSGQVQVDSPLVLLWWQPSPLSPRWGFSSALFICASALRVILSWFYYFSLLGQAGNVSFAIKFLKPVHPPCNSGMFKLLTSGSSTELFWITTSPFFISAEIFDWIHVWHNVLKLSSKYLWCSLQSMLSHILYIDRLRIPQVSKFWFLFDSC